MGTQAPKATSRATLDLLPGIAIGLLSLGTAVGVTLTPSDTTKLVAIFPPWWSAQAVFAAASQAGFVVGRGAFPFIVAIRDNRAETVGELKARGALFVVDGAAFSICSGRPEQASK